MLKHHINNKEKGETNKKQDKEREYKLQVYKHFTYTCVVDRLRLSSDISYLTTSLYCAIKLACEHTHI